MSQIISKDNLLTKISNNWRKILDNDELDKIIDNLNASNLSYDMFSPPPEKIFEFARLTPINQIKIIILGQDPYPSKNDAHGLAFSCLTKIPATLRNIYKCLSKTCNIKGITTGDLSNWAQQGVLLLNTYLSTKCGSSLSHKKTWSLYTTQLISDICRNAYDDNNQLIFLLWGGAAKSYKDIIDSDYHYVLEWLHPSPLSQIKAAPPDKFENCDHFIISNNILMELDKKPIEWNPEVLTDECMLQCNDYFQCNPRKHIVFTDGSCYPNNKSSKSEGGYAAIFACGTYNGLKIYGKLQKKIISASNIRAEGMALIKVLKYLKKLDSSSWDMCEIILDCEFWIKMIHLYMPAWNIADFNNKSNTDLTKMLWTIWSKDNFGKKIILTHMNSHNKSGWKSKKIGTRERFMYEMNDRVDKLATHARLTLDNGKYKIHF